jgi:cyanophycinase
MGNLYESADIHVEVNKGVKVMKRFSYFLIIIIGLILVSSSVLEAKGNLVIIGGGSRSTDMVKRIIDLAGGDGAKIVIVPLASGDQLEAVLYQRHEFEQAGADNVTFLLLPLDEPINTESNLAAFEGASGVYFTGGDQSRITKAMLNTEMLEIIKKIYQDGGMVGGSSAGAAIMSKIMITGDELKNPDSTNKFNSIREGNVVHSEGLGFLDTVIVDQHFIERKRHNRLISLVLENPELVGVGISESTAIFVKPDDTFEVMGEGSVQIYDARSAGGITTDKNGNYAVHDVRMHLLMSGQQFDLKTNEVIK